ncbi:MAG: hypothetical protein GY820_17145 [Gammaproteobacteria bacterium]|nr:hypothetical protein [Gammaproteobacteria bacterium]
MITAWNQLQQFLQKRIFIHFTTSAPKFLDDFGMIRTDIGCATTYPKSSLETPYTYLSQEKKIKILILRQNFDFAKSVIFLHILNNKSKMAPTRKIWKPSRERV